MDLCIAASHPHSKARICSIKSFFYKVSSGRTYTSYKPFNLHSVYPNLNLSSPHESLLYSQPQSVGLLIPQEPKQETWL